MSHAQHWAAVRAALKLFTPAPAEHGIAPSQMFYVNIKNRAPRTIARGLRALAAQVTREPLRAYVTLEHPHGCRHVSVHGPVRLVTCWSFDYGRMEHRLDVGFTR